MKYIKSEDQLAQLKMSSWIIVLLLTLRMICLKVYLMMISWIAVKISGLI